MAAHPVYERDSMKVFFRRIHLYLALIAGLVVLNTCLTGTLLVFQDEIELLINHDLYFVKTGASRLPLSQLTEKVTSLQPGVKIQNVRVYNEPDRSVEITYQLKKAKGGGGERTKGEEGKPGGQERKEQKPGVGEGHKEGINQKTKEGREEGAKGEKKEGKEGKKEGKKDDNFRAYLDPYTDNLISVVDNKKTFYYKVLFLHRQLLAGETGKVITGTSAAIFVFIIITGLILWWPSKRNQLKQKLTIKRGANWKRTIHDWHTVLGFYAAIFLFISALTGTIIAFKWASNTIFYATNSPLQNPEPPQSVAPFDKGQKGLAIDKALAAATDEYPHAVLYQVNMAKSDSGSLAVNVLSPGASYKNMTDALYFDQYSGAKTGQLLFTDRSKGAKIRAYVLPLHTGSIFGLPSRIIALLVVMIGATLPVTGVAMWINRIRKKKSSKASQQQG
jgi:uncharacterized iron-regulated membrane protein